MGSIGDLVRTATARTLLDELEALLGQLLARQRRGDRRHKDRDGVACLGLGVLVHG